MPWLLSPMNAIDDLKIGLYESGIVTRRLEGDRARRQERRDLVKQGACYVMFPENAGFTKTKELAINRGNEYETRYGSTISELFAYQQGRHVQGSRRPRGHPIRGTHGSGT